MKKDNDFLKLYEETKTVIEKNLPEKDQDSIDRLRDELKRLMEGEINEKSVERISEICWELERLQPVLHEFDPEKAQKKFFQKYYPLAQNIRNGSIM